MIEEVVHLEPPSEDETTPLEEAIITRALDCDRMRKPADPAFLLKILRMESQLDLPPELKGMLLAAACHESGYEAGNEGDHRFSPTGRPKAIGLLQQWPWVESYYGIDRRDPEAAATAWLTHIESQLEPTEALCGYEKGSERLWVAAWVRAVRAPPRRCLLAALRTQGVIEPDQEVSWGQVNQLARKFLPSQKFRSCQRCFQESKHYARLKEWRVTWAHIDNTSAQKGEATPRGSYAVGTLQ